MSTVREHLAAHHAESEKMWKSLGAHMRGRAEYHKTAGDNHHAIGKAHGSHGHAEVARLNKAMGDEHHSAAEDYGGTAELCEAHGAHHAELRRSLEQLTSAPQGATAREREAVSEKTVDVEALAKKVATYLLDGLVPTQLSGIVPTVPIRPIPRAGQCFPVQPEKPNVSLEFEKLFTVEEGL